MDSIKFWNLFIHGKKYYSYYFLDNFFFIEKKLIFFPTVNSTNFAKLLRKIHQIFDITKLEQNLRNIGVWCKIVEWQVLTKSTKFANFWEFLWQIYNITKLKETFKCYTICCKARRWQDHICFHIWRFVEWVKTFKLVFFLSKICHTITTS